MRKELYPEITMLRAHGGSGDASVRSSVIRKRNLCPVYLTAHLSIHH